MMLAFPTGRARWLTRRVLTEPHVDRINLAWFSQFGDELRPLATDFYGVAEELGRTQLATVRPALDALLGVSSATTGFSLSLRSSRAAIQQLLNLIVAVLDSTDQGEFERQRISILLKASEVRTLVNAELAVQAVYLVFPKRAYNTDLFIADGTLVFSASCRAQFTDEERYDITQGTRCLAFEVPTAAAFHLLRATESVIRRHYGEVVGTLPTQKSRNWGVYITNLRKCGADAKIVSALEEMKDLYRNPIIHPETQIEIEEALSMLGIAETVINAMIADMAKRKAIKAKTAAPVLAVRSP